MTAAAKETYVEYDLILENDCSKMYDEWVHIWERSIDKAFFESLVEGVILPSFHPPDKETFITMVKLHKETCKQQEHILDIAGYVCKVSEAQQREKHQKFLKLMCLFDIIAKSDDGVLKERARVYKMSGYYMVWGKTSETELTARLKLAFPGYDFTNDVRADFTFESCKIVKRRRTGKK